MTVEIDAAAPAGGSGAAASPTTIPAVIEPAANVEGDVPSSWVALMRLTARINNTTFVPSALRGKPAEVLACMITGQELGLEPMISLRMINVIEGRPALSAELMRALVNRAGHRLSVVEAKQDKVTLYGRRTDTGSEATVTWTLEDAKRANLLGRGAWTTYPRSMLLARATSELCRQIFSDVIAGLYTEEETASIEGHAWEPDDPSMLVDPVTGEIVVGAQSDSGVSQDAGATGEQISPVASVPGEPGPPVPGSPDQLTIEDTPDE
jgi:hypothetical protein